MPTTSLASITHYREGTHVGETVSLIGGGSRDGVVGYGSNASSIKHRELREEGLEAELGQHEHEHGLSHSSSSTSIPSNSTSPTNSCSNSNSTQDYLWKTITGTGCSGNISLRLQNSGSVARDHLASERTFLAYMRTSLAIVSAGVALVQLFIFNAATESPTGMGQNYARPLGACVIVMGIIVLAIGLTRYFTIQSALVKGYFPAARLAATFIAFSLVVLISVIFAILVTGSLGVDE